MGESRLFRGGTDRPSLALYRDTQQTARFLSSQAKKLDALDVSVFTVWTFCLSRTFVSDWDEFMMLNLRRRRRRRR